MEWYDGMTVLQVLDSFENIQPSHQLPFRMPVQGVYKFTAGGDMRRIIAGTVDSGSCARATRWCSTPRASAPR